MREYFKNKSDGSRGLTLHVAHHDGVVEPSLEDGAIIDAVLESSDPECDICGARFANPLVGLIEWAWVELNYRPHAYQARSYECEIGLEVLLSGNAMVLADSLFDRQIAPVPDAPSGRCFPDSRGLRHLDQTACLHIIYVSINGNFAWYQRVPPDALHIGTNALGLVTDSKPVDERRFL